MKFYEKSIKGYINNICRLLDLEDGSKIVAGDDRGEINIYDFFSGTKV